MKADGASLPVEAIKGVLFYATPVMFLYAVVVLFVHCRRHGDDFFWMTELLLFLVPVLLLGRYFFLGLLVLGLAGDGVP